MEILPIKEGTFANARRGGADSNYIYIGDDPETKAFADRCGFGIATDESCFIRALRQSECVSDTALNDISCRVQT
jgi:hypothetical protein